MKIKQKIINNKIMMNKKYTIILINKIMKIKQKIINNKIIMNKK